MTTGEYVLFILPEPVLDDSNWDFQLLKSVSRRLGVRAVAVGRGRVRWRGSYIAPLINLDPVKLRGFRDLIHYTLYNVIYLIYAVRLLIKEGRPTLLISLDSYRFFLAYILLSNLRVRKIAWWGGDPFKFLPARSPILRPLKPLLSLMTITIGKTAEALVTTDSESATVLSKVIGRKLHRIASILNIEPFLAKERRERHDGKLRVVYSGRISEEKNLELLVEACSYVKGCELVLTGYVESSPYLNRLKRLAGKNGTRLTYLGFLPIEELADLYTRCHVAVLTSKSGEGTPGFLITSLAAGLPFVGPAIGDIPQLVNGYGIIFSHPITGERLAQLITEVAERRWSMEEMREYVKRIQSRSVWTWLSLVKILLKR
ncbi:MAG TPA: glycosyltransferase [Candidatus Caldiarchaeum subterraneum]|uniref:Glycosyltransferase n=1 Tax=Caldiarchaeum subterraneum TaxID=311458 RepID=A0A832ZU41_CALS0|nr:glycosyltransferase [Aigarchaeota archaeon]HIQ29004.1 glycosyltransferase [Candidatus Caldarchaeum subterraneum]